MPSRSRIQAGLSLALLVCIADGPLAAATITFDGMGSGTVRTLDNTVFGQDTLVSTVTEGAFTYGPLNGALASRTGNGGLAPYGSLFAATHQGGGPDAAGGELVIRSATPGGQFTFVRLDLLFFGIPFTNQPLVLTSLVEGWRGGVSIAGDALAGAGQPNPVWGTQAAVDLAGVNIDELRIQLPALYFPGSLVSAWIAVDNLVLGEATPDASPTPEPGTMMLMAGGIIWCLLRRR